MMIDKNIYSVKDPKQELMTFDDNCIDLLMYLFRLIQAIPSSAPTACLSDFPLTNAGVLLPDRSEITVNLPKLPILTSSPSART